MGVVDIIVKLNVVLNGGIGKPELEGLIMNVVRENKYNINCNKRLNIWSGTGYRRIHFLPFTRDGRDHVHQTPFS